jgi:hypothetical protein
MNKYFTILLFISLLSISSCRTKTSKPKNDAKAAVKKYDWIPTECAPEEYPVQIYKGNLLYGIKGAGVDIPDGVTVKNGWGEEGSLPIAGDLQGSTAYATIKLAVIR